MADTVSVSAGYKVCKFLSPLARGAIFSELTWERFRAYQKGADDEGMRGLHKVIRNIDVLGVLSPENTKDLRFKYSPEYTL